MKKHPDYEACAVSERSTTSTTTFTPRFIGDEPAPARGVVDCAPLEAWFNNGCPDECEDDSAKVTPGVCGCGVSDIDTDGADGEWSQWNGCDAECGPGNQLRQYSTCALTQDRDCDAAVPCPIDCNYSWAEWTDCSALEGCLSGFKMRSLDIDTEPAHGGRACPIIPETVAEREVALTALLDHWQAVFTASNNLAPTTDDMLADEVAAELVRQLAAFIDLDAAAMQNQIETCYAPPQAVGSPDVCSPVCFPESAPVTDLKLDWKNLKSNNLGGMGPNAGDPPVLRFGGVGIKNGEVFDLEISLKDPAGHYIVRNSGRNGFFGEHVGQINFGGDVDHPGSTTLVFTFRDSNTNAEVRLDKFFWAFLDFDTNGPGTTGEVLCVDDDQLDFLHSCIPGYNMDFWGSDAIGVTTSLTRCDGTAGSTSTSFTALNPGYLCDNPTNVDLLHVVDCVGCKCDSNGRIPAGVYPQHQADKTVELAFRAMSHFEVTVTIPTTGESGRNILFSGQTSMCGDCNPEDVATAPEEPARHVLVATFGPFPGYAGPALVDGAMGMAVDTSMSDETRLVADVRYMLTGFAPNEELLIDLYSGYSCESLAYVGEDSNAPFVTLSVNNSDSASFLASGFTFAADIDGKVVVDDVYTVTPAPYDTLSSLAGRTVVIGSVTQGSDTVIDAQGIAYQVPTRVACGVFEVSTTAEMPLPPENGSTRPHLLSVALTTLAVVLFRFLQAPGVCW